MKKPTALVDRVRAALAGQPQLQEKRMFGSVGFMVRGKLCIGAREERLMCRIDPARHAELSKAPGCREVVMRGRGMKGYVYVDAAALQTAVRLRRWVRLSLEFTRGLADKT